MSAPSQMELVLKHPTFDLEGKEEGRRRSARAVQFGRRHRNGLMMDRDCANLQDERAAIGERYAKAYFDPIEWNAIHDITHFPDLGELIDIKTTNRSYDPPDIAHLLHWAGEGDPAPVLNWAYVLVVPDTRGRGHWLVGWELGEMLARAPIKTFQAGRPAYAIRGRDLRPIQVLRALISTVRS